MNKEANMEKVFFKIHGDFITDHIRSLYEEGSIHKSWETYSTITEDKDIFRDIIKGRKTFDGINEFSLIDCQNEDIADKVLSSLVISLNNAKTDLEKFKEKFNSPIKFEDGEDEEMTLGEYIDFKNGSYKTIENNVEQLEQNLNLVKELFNYTEDDIVLSFLQKCSSKDLSEKYGWITEKGLFIPVPFAGHDQFIYEFNEKMKTNFSVANLEKRWVRITSSMGVMAISAYNFTLKPKQSITLEKWILKHDAIKDGESLSIFGYGEAERTGKKIKFIKHSAD